MSYETLKAPELSPLAPCNVGVCHLPLFHVIWYKYTKWAACVLATVSRISVAIWKEISSEMMK